MVAVARAEASVVEVTAAEETVAEARWWRRGRRRRWRRRGGGGEGGGEGKARAEARVVEVRWRSRRWRRQRWRRRGCGGETVETAALATRWRGWWWRGWWQGRRQRWWSWRLLARVLEARVEATAEARVAGWLG